MVRVGGLAFDHRASAPREKRIENLRFLGDGQPIDPNREYMVAGWASVNEGTVGPPVYDIVESHIKKQQEIAIESNTSVRLVS